MSGTSLDGLDLVFCQITESLEKWSYELIKTQTIAYSKEWKNKLSNAPLLTSLDLALLDIDYGIWIGRRAGEFIKDNRLDPDFISSHGHTVFHQPEAGITLQIGSGNHIALETKLPTITDFRSLDVALGGQGAPLAPTGDKYLFNQYDFCLNLGGISNISYESQGIRKAFDIGPVNMLLNHLASKLNQEFDEDGKIASSGELDVDLFKELNQLDYYQTPAPKSLGREWFEKNIVPIFDKSNIDYNHKFRTAIEHITYEISLCINGALHNIQPSKLLVTGGGAKNSFLIDILSNRLDPRIQLIIPSEDIVDYKEALIFSFLGVLRMQNRPNCLSSVTGARVDNCGGILYNYKVGI